MVYYHLYETVEEMISCVRRGTIVLPLKAIGVFSDIPDANTVVGGTLVPAAEYPSYWSRDIPTVVFLLGATGYILLTP